MVRANPHLRDFWSVREVNGLPVRFRVLWGGRDSTKSSEAALRASWLASRGKIRILCARMFQSNIEESVYSTIRTQVDRFGLDGEFDFQTSRIFSKSGSRIFFYGMQRSYEEIKSTDNIDILWLEQPEYLTKEMWLDIEPTIRKEHSEIWLTFNPRYITDFVWQRFIKNPPDDALVYNINYDKNIFLSEASKKTIARMKSESMEDYRHVYLGEPLEDSDDIIIKRSWVQAAVGASLGIDDTGVRKVGFDPSAGGKEKRSGLNGLALRYGNILKGLYEWDSAEEQILKSTHKVYDIALDHSAEVVFDIIGVGATVGENIKEINSRRGNDVLYKPFWASGKVANPKGEYRTGIMNENQFATLKDQSWWLLADRFRNTYNYVVNGEPSDNIICIDKGCKHIDQLILELSTPRREYTQGGKLRVQSKSDLKHSPNLADAVVMAFAPEQRNKIARML